MEIFLPNMPNSMIMKRDLYNYKQEFGNVNNWWALCIACCIVIWSNLMCSVVEKMSLFLLAIFRVALCIKYLLLMSLGFLVLFYTFPAGMVLYWTTNNLISVIKTLWKKYKLRV